MSEGKARRRLSPGKRIPVLLGCLACAWIKGWLLYEALRDGEAWFPRSTRTVSLASEPDRYWIGVGVTSIWLVLSLAVAAALVADWMSRRADGPDP